MTRVYPTTILKDKIYTLYEILASGFLLNAQGEPYRNIKTIRDLLKRAKYRPVQLVGKNQPGYQVKGSDLIKLQKSLTHSK